MRLRDDLGLGDSAWLEPGRAVRFAGIVRDVFGQAPGIPRSRREALVEFADARVDAFLSYFGQDCISARKEAGCGIDRSLG